jgi:hypothetical protein
MRLPNYSAELSLRPQGEAYAGVADPSRKSSGQGVEPQMLCHCYEGGACYCTTCSDGFCWTTVIHRPTLY